jgi:hypothetical protein
LMSRLFEIFLMETFVMLFGATASRRNERRRRFGQDQGMNRAEHDVYLVRYGL